MPQGAKRPTGAVIEWDQFYTEQMTIWHLILAEDHLLYWYANGPDKNCAGCLVWHGEKLKAMVAIEAPKFFTGKHLETYGEIGIFSQRVQDKILSHRLTRPLAHEYALKARQLRYELAKYKTYDFSSGELASLLASLEDGNHKSKVEALLATLNVGIPVLVGSTCRDSQTGEFLPITECEATRGYFDLTQTVLDFYNFCQDVQPAYEKGAGLGQFILGRAVMALPNVGTKKSVSPRDFNPRSLSIGYIHNHPSGLPVLSINDLDYAKFQQSVHPFRWPQVAIAVYNDRLSQYHGLVLAAVLKGTSVPHRQAYTTDEQAEQLKQYGWWYGVWHIEFIEQYLVHKRKLQPKATHISEGAVKIPDFRFRRGR